MQRTLLISLLLTFSNFINAQSENEPNNTITQANFLSTNISGNISPASDTDWYKFGTDINKGVIMHVIPPTGLPLSISFYYYKSGILTLISSHTVSTETDVYQGGLGRNRQYYYLKIAPLNAGNTHTGSYSITKTFVSVFDDVEPNNGYLNARPLKIGDSARGNINYYNTSDTVDFYYLNLADDVNLNVNLHSYNGAFLVLNVLASNGKTLISSVNNSVSDSLKVHGLSAGKYYLALKSFDSTSFSDYKLIVNIENYKDAAEPNNRFHDAKTIPANDTATGTVNFYSYPGVDSVDYWKINYTGTTGKMQLSFYPQSVSLNGNASPVLFEVYKETYKPPVYSSYYSSASGDIHLKGLTAGLYYIKVKGGGQPYAYSIIDSFAQTKVDLQITSKSDKVICDNVNFIKAKILGQGGPYTIERYYFNQLQYKTELRNSLPITFSDIPAGIYKFRGYADGATGHAIDSQTIYFIPVPATLTSYNITKTTATIEWNKPYCAEYFSIRYRSIRTAAWTTVTTGDTYFYNFTNLNPSTTYEWQVAVGDSANGVSGIGSYSVLDSFTTASSFASTYQPENLSVKNLNSNSNIIYPNPAKTQFTILYNPAKNTGTVSLRLKNMNGLVVWNKNNIAATAAKGTVVDVSKLPAGVYMLHITDHNNNTVTVKKVVVSR